MLMAGLQKLGVMGVWVALIFVLIIPDPEAAKPVKKIPPTPSSKFESKAPLVAAAMAITLPPPPEPLAAPPKVNLEKVVLMKKAQASQKPPPTVVKINPLPKNHKPFKEKPAVIVNALAKKIPKPATTSPVKTQMLVKPLRPKLKKSTTLNSRSIAALPLKKISQPGAEKVTVRPKRNGAAAKEGRVLLRLLEHGIGPVVEIAWPSNAAARNKLYETLRRCHGMRVAVFVPDRGLFLSDSAPRQAQTLNTDRYSGFVRQSQGSVVTAESRVGQQIRQRHSLAYSGNSVRLFPRSEDAVLLGGLSSLTGTGYRNAQAIRAIYRQNGNKLYIENITMDHQNVEGRIDLLDGSCR